MKNLYQTMFDYFKNNPMDWNYYFNELEFPKNINDARNFITNYFAYGGKGYLIHDIIQECEVLRINHTLSVFFIGLLIKNSSFHDLKIVDDNKNEIFEFSYLWFLVSLYHDMGYVQENDWTYKFKYREKSNIFKNNMINSVFKYKFFNYCNYSMYYDLGIVFSVPSNFRKIHTKTKQHDSYHLNSFEYTDGITFNNGIKIKKGMYTKKTIFNYLEYCKVSNINHYDHGIVGGLWLYDSLVKNYYLSYISLNDKHIDFNDFYVNNLHFSTTQFPVFAYLADCIISHNMWFATDNKTIELYKKCGLEQLISPHVRPIRFDNNPLLFILALADTLEPIKTCSSLDKSTIDILNNIKCKFSNNQIFLSFENIIMFSKMVEKLKGLSKWLAINVQIYENANKICITF